uniref:Uncharacterized protein n=1 Tax=Lepeophtheirus salmonis TaxID=72036 RepID=A0A0K2U4T9_LEPSM
MSSLLGFSIDSLTEVVILRSLLLSFKQWSPDCNFQYPLLVSIPSFSESLPVSLFLISSIFRAKTDSYSLICNRFSLMFIQYVQTGKCYVIGVVPLENLIFTSFPFTSFICGIV